MTVGIVCGSTSFFEVAQVGTMHRKDFDWLELLLVLAGLALFFQLVQSAWCGLIRVVGRP